MTATIIDPVYEIAKREHDVLGIWIFSPHGSTAHCKSKSIEHMVATVQRQFRPSFESLVIRLERVTWYINRVEEITSLMCTENRSDVDWSRDNFNIAKNAKLVAKKTDETMIGVFLNEETIEEVALAIKKEIGPVGNVVLSDAMSDFGIEKGMKLAAEEISSLVNYIRHVSEACKTQISKILKEKIK
jgi:hypothetical protein